MSEDARRALPSVDRLLREPGIAKLLTEAPRSVVVAAARAAVANARTRRAGPPEDWAEEVREQVARRLTPSLRPVLNATGVVLHTNLGRAPLAESAVRAAAALAADYSALEFDLSTGERGPRGESGRALLRDLAGAEDALVVNNAAAALVLALRALAPGAGVAISRGELIEIGGSFRIPEIVETSGARLHEVGTTNRTHADDYRRALVAGASAILTVHRSNFAQQGFVATPAPAELATLAREAGVPYVYDIGSGLLADLSPFGLTGEPTVREAVASGADLVVFSGDKLLGGPQAGCIVGRREAVRRAARHPFARAVRADKLTLAALEATLRLYLDEEDALREIPVLRMLTLPVEELARRAAALAALCPAELRPTVVAGASAVGGGSFPGVELPTSVVALESAALGADGLALRLRLGDPAVVGRVAEGRLLLDPRTLPEATFAAVAGALRAALDG